jgi:hypothetical protein
MFSGCFMVRWTSLVISSEWHITRPIHPDAGKRAGGGLLARVIGTR